MDSSRVFQRCIQGCDDCAPAPGAKRKRHLDIARECKLGATLLVRPSIFYLRKKLLLRLVDRPLRRVIKSSKELLDSPSTLCDRDYVGALRNREAVTFRVSLHAGFDCHPNGV